MHISISIEQLTELVVRQLNNLFGLGKEETELLTGSMAETVKKVEYCFSFNTTRYYRKGTDVFFNPFQAAQYTIFLYFLGRILFEKNGNSILADKVYYLNRALNGVDLYYEVKLPEVFGLDHPLGSVIGRGRFSNFFHFSQGCTVGNNHGVYPSFAENVIMLAGSTVIGKSHIGDKCIISANTYIKEQDIPGNSVVFGVSPNLVIKKIDDSYFLKYSNFSLEPS
jgi:serine O-acetyltransferase